MRMPPSRLASLFVTATAAVLVAGLASAGDAEHGRQVFESNCAICHTYIEGLMDKSGPNLRGLLNRQAGTTKYRFGFTDVVAQSGIVWRPETLNLFLRAPARMMRGTKMVFPGLEDDRDRADLICYLQLATNTGDQPVSPDCR
jgi:cytochrome c